MHSITFDQGLWLAVMAVILGIDFWLEGLYIFRPIIVCSLTGWIIGDLHTGLIAGGLTELAFAGLTPAGGTQPPNPILAGVMTTVIAFTTGVEPIMAIGLALPFSFLMQYIILFYYSFFSLFMVKADQYAETGNIKAFWLLNIVTTVIVAITYGVVVFLCTYVAQDYMQYLVSSMPEWLTHGFEIAGGILPAVGFGMLLKVMLKGQYIPYLIIGFLIASFLKFSNLLPVALVGTALAMYEYYNAKEKASTVQPILVEGDDYSEGI